MTRSNHVRKVKIQSIIQDVSDEKMRKAIVKTKIREKYIALRGQFQYRKYLDKKKNHLFNSRFYRFFTLSQEALQSFGFIG